jgi:predicted ATP-binding protein involved in virulence
MLYLKQLNLKNYCSYEDYSINFTRPDGQPYKYVCFFGPNGIGKSSILEAISMLTANWSGRGESFVKQSLQKYVRNEDYDPAWQRVLDAGKEIATNGMMIEGIYVLDDKEYIVQLTQDGYVRNDFAPIPSSDLDGEDRLVVTQSGPWGRDHLKYRQRIAHFMKSDSDLSMHKFQLHHSQKDKFEKIISTIMRYPTKVADPAGFTSDERSYCVDVTIEKKGHKIHFKRMSAGERKICKAFSEILNTMHALEFPSSGEEAMAGWPPLLLIDNVVMHVYYDRHVQMIDCLKEVFAKQQIFATTHSGVLIQRHLQHENDKDSELMIDLENING